MEEARRFLRRISEENQKFFNRAPNLSGVPATSVVESQPQLKRSKTKNKHTSSKFSRAASKAEEDVKIQYELQIQKLREIISPGLLDREKGLKEKGISIYELTPGEVVSTYKKFLDSDPEAYGKDYYEPQNKNLDGLKKELGLIPAINLDEAQRHDSVSLHKEAEEREIFEPNDIFNVIALYLSGRSATAPEVKRKILAIKNENDNLLATIDLSFAVKEKISTINFLYTHPDYRGLQFATILMLKAVELSIQENCWFVELEKPTNEAIPLYAKFGFAPILFINKSIELREAPIHSIGRNGDAESDSDSEVDLETGRDRIANHLKKKGNYATWQRLPLKVKTTLIHENELGVANFQFLSLVLWFPEIQELLKGIVTQPIKPIERVDVRPKIEEGLRDPAHEEADDEDKKCLELQEKYKLEIQSLQTIVSEGLKSLEERFKKDGIKIGKLGSEEIPAYKDFLGNDDSWGAYAYSFYNDENKNNLDYYKKEFGLTSEKILNDNEPSESSIFLQETTERKVIPEPKDIFEVIALHLSKKTDLMKPKLKREIWAIKDAQGNLCATSDLSFEAEEKTCEINFLFTHPKHQKKKLATILMLKTLDLALQENCYLVRLDYPTDEAIRLYLNFGFAPNLLMKEIISLREKVSTISTEEERADRESDASAEVDSDSESDDWYLEEGKKDESQFQEKIASWLKNKPDYSNWLSLNKTLKENMLREDFDEEALSVSLNLRFSELQDVIKNIIGQLIKPVEEEGNAKRKLDGPKDSANEQKTKKYKPQQKDKWSPTLQFSEKEKPEGFTDGPLPEDYLKYLTDFADFDPGSPSLG